MNIINTLIQQLNLEGLQHFLSHAVTRLVKPFKDKGGRISVKNIVNKVFNALHLPKPTAANIKSAVAQMGVWYHQAVNFFVASIGEINIKSSALVNKITAVLGNALGGMVFN